MKEIKRTAKVLLVFCDLINYFLTLWELFIEKNYNFGVLLGSIAILLNILIYALDHANKIVLFFDFVNNKNSGTIYFFIITLLYVLCNGFLLWYDICSKGFSFSIFFCNFTVIPICYSLLVLGTLCFKTDFYTIYGSIMYIITPFPYYIVIIGLIIEEMNIFYKIAAAIILIILPYILVNITLMLVCDFLSDNNKNIKK